MFTNFIVFLKLFFKMNSFFSCETHARHLEPIKIRFMRTIYRTVQNTCFVTYRFWRKIKHLDTLCPSAKAYDIVARSYVAHLKQTFWMLYINILIKKYNYLSCDYFCHASQWWIMMCNSPSMQYRKYLGPNQLWPMCLKSFFFVGV